MFNRLRTLFGAKPRAGDLVTILEGPRAGTSGTVTSATGCDVSVDIGEDHEATLPPHALRIVRRAPPGSRAPDAGTDLDYEEARARINQLPPPMV